MVHLRWVVPTVLAILGGLCESLTSLRTVTQQDALLDVVVSYDNYGGVYLLVGLSATSFAAEPVKVCTESSNGGIAVALADINGDGWVDVVAADIYGPGGTVVYMNGGDRTFVRVLLSPPASAGIPDGLSIYAGALFVVTLTDDGVAYVTGTNASVFAVSGVEQALNGASSTALVAGPLLGDPGSSQIVLAAGSDVVWLDPRANFTAIPIASCPSGVTGSSLALVPIINRGTAVLVRCEATNDVLLVMPLSLSAPGVFDAPRLLLALGVKPSAIACIPIASSGPLCDIIIAGVGIMWYRQQSAGVFLRSGSSVTTSATDIRAMASWDMNADGFVDVVVASYEDNKLVVLRGAGFGFNATELLLTPPPSFSYIQCQPCQVSTCLHRCGHSVLSDVGNVNNRS